MQSPYQSYISAILSNEIIEIAQGKIVSGSNLPNENLYYLYHLPAIDKDGNLPPDEDVETIYLNTAVEELLKAGADLLYKNSNSNYVFIEILKSNVLSEKLKDQVFNNIDIELLNKLPPEKNNEIFNQLLSSVKDIKIYELIDRGLKYNQSSYFNEESPSEIKDLNKGFIGIFKLLQHDPFLIDLTHKYTYKKEYDDNPEENALTITLKDKLESILSYTKIMSQEEVVINYNIFDYDNFKNNLFKINEIFKPILHFNELEKKLNKKYECKIKNKI